MKNILFLILIIVAAMIIGSATKSTNTKMILFRGKIIDFVIAAYITLLLISTAVTFGIMIKQESKSERVSAEEISKAVKAGENFADYVETGMLPDADGVFVNQEWHFPYESNRLIITSKTSEQNWAVVERKKEFDDNNQVGIVQYATKSIIDDYDYSHHLKPPKITVNEQGIIIEPSEQTELKLAKFTKEFTISQFTEKQFANQRIFGGVNNVRGQNVLYLYVPQSVEVVEEKGVYLQFID
ncbi:hypothetical protein P9265_09010 [Schinkia azotoformans]|uniref:hypothetical protein n=1 Tax=Schinkia azotoformans TaxID=1454 RepID=UPI002E1E72A7|nr:hypothetical protein [Schinkia azotoformans]